MKNARKGPAKGFGFRTFTRTWWEDDACTILGAGEKMYRGGTRFRTEQEARDHCKAMNAKRGPTGRGPRGLATEYEEA